MEESRSMGWREMRPYTCPKHFAGEDLSDYPIEYRCRFLALFFSPLPLFLWENGRKSRGGARKYKKNENFY
jgi:hypothetical protein